MLAMFFRFWEGFHRRMSEQCSAAADTIEKTIMEATMTQYYVGVKIIETWEEPAPKDMGAYKTGDPGYAVKYEDGYISWSPKEVFERAYVPCGFNRDSAVVALYSARAAIKTSIKAIEGL